MADGTPNVDAPDGFDVGTIDDAVVDESKTTTVWVTDDDAGVAYWFEMKADVPLRKKNDVLERNLTTEQGPDGDPRQNLSSDYYTDLIEYMVVDWFGADEDNDDVPSLTVFLNKMSAVFEDLQDEVPPPFESLPDGERKK
jgi:hypothetical protein